MAEKVVVSYQGARFQLGRGQTFIAIWPEGAPLEQPLEQWPATPDGWSAAWSRFTELEGPGTIAPVGTSRSAGAAGQVTEGSKAALRVTNSAALLVIGVVFGVVALFPSYVGGSSLASSSQQWVPHVMYIAAWALGAIGVLLGGWRARAGATLALGTSAVTLGMFIADIGQIGSGVSAGAGLILACIGWLACTAGSVLAVRSGYPWRELFARPRGGAIGVVVLLVLSAIGVVVTFAPPWDSFVLRVSSGQAQTVTLGNAFSAPGVVIFGNVVVMVLILVVAMLAGVWRSVRLGAVLLIGALVPIAAQAISAVIQYGQATPPSQFGFSQSQATQAGLTISNGLTAWFWLYCVFGVALAISAAWMLLTPSAPVAPATVSVPPASAATVPEKPAPAAVDIDEPSASPEAASGSSSD